MRGFLVRRWIFVFTLVLLQLDAGPQAQSTQLGEGKPPAQSGSPAATRRPSPKICAACIRAHMEFLASDAMQGRGSGTHDELVAATYIAAQLRQYGIEPAGDEGGYIQKAPTARQALSAPPVLSFTAPNDAAAKQVDWTHGKEMLVLNLSQPEFSGPLQKIEIGGDLEKAKAGAIVYLFPKAEADRDAGKLQSAAFSAISQGAIAVLVPASPERRQHWEEAAKKLPQLPLQLENGPANDMGEHFNVVALNDDAQATLKELPDGTVLLFEGHAAPPDKGYTWNAVGVLRGRDPRKNAILLSAHLDHLGIGAPVNGDSIYNGADDDASGTTAVLELARVLGAGTRPLRTVIFALFGSEEAGGLGSTYFREHPPVPLKEMAADLEFEMIGRPDPKVPDDSLWLTGWERSNLGPALAAHGAKLVADMRPEQGFFRRSDNYPLAKKGVVAHTISSFGLHKDYHQPSDDLAHIDFPHMTVAIRSLIRPVEWLVNSDFRPQWKPGGKP